MTHDEIWKMRCHDYATFIKSNGRCPSRHFPEERNLHSWWKHTRKLHNAGMLNASRLEDFKKLLDLAEKNRHVNQYQ